MRGNDLIIKGNDTVLDPRFAGYAVALFTLSGHLADGIPVEHDIAGGCGNVDIDPTCTHRSIVLHTGCTLGLVRPSA